MSEQVPITVTKVAGECRISPCETVVHPGDTIAFINNTGGDVHVQISEDVLFQKTVTVPSGSHPGTVTVPPHVRGWFPYAVFCEETNDFAVCGSMPIVIIIRS